MERRLSRLDADIAEGPGYAVHPQGDAAFSMPQVIDHQAGLRAAIDRDADFLLRHDDAGVKPPGAIRNGLDSGFVKRVACPCAAPPPCTQATRRTAHRDCAPPRRRPRIGTDESTPPRKSWRPRRRTPGRGNSLLLAAAAQIDLQRAFGELHVLHERQTDVATDGRIAMRFQTYDRPLHGGVGVDHSPAFRVLHTRDREPGCLARRGRRHKERRSRGSSWAWPQRISCPAESTIMRRSRPQTDRFRDHNVPMWG